MAATTRIALAACLASGCFAPVGNGGVTSSGTGSVTGSGTDTGSGEISGTSNETDTPTTGEPSQCSWRSLDLISGPPARSEHSMVYDSHNDQVILFGGSVNNTDRNDLWTFDGSQWTEIKNAAPPSERRAHAATYDPIRRVMVVFGGVTGQNDTLQPLGDTYLYDPKLNTWQNATPSKAPAPRYGASMAFYTGNALLFGGNLDPSTTDSEHWSWDSFNWTLLEATNNTRPDPRSRHMAAPGPDGKLLLYGGCKEGSLCVLNTPTHAYNDTWSWDGVQWKLLFETAGDGQLGAMALQSKNNRLYRFDKQDTYLWDDGTWSAPQPSDLISGPFFAVADHSTGLIRFGGNIANQNTWVLDCPP